MAKEREKELAYSYYVEQGLTAKATAEKVKVTQKTMSTWVNKFAWKEIRTATQSKPETLLKNYYDLLEVLVEKRLEYERDKVKDDKYKNTIDEISKISKAIDNLKKDGKPSLSTYISCIEKFTDALHKEQPELYRQLIDFQTQHMQAIATEY